MNRESLIWIKIKVDVGKDNYNIKVASIPFDIETDIKQVIVCDEKGEIQSIAFLDIDKKEVYWKSPPAKELIVKLSDRLREVFINV